MTAKRTRRLLVLGLILTVCAGGVLYVVTFQQSILQNVAREIIAGSLGDQVVIQRIRVELFPRPQLRLTDVSIPGPNGDKPIFQASNIRLALNLFFAGQDAPAPNVLFVDHARLSLERDRDGRWNYHELVHDAPPSRLWAFLSGYALEFVNGSLDIEDRFQRDAPVRVRAEEVELQVDRFTPDGEADVMLSARLFERGTRSMLSSYGTIHHIGGFLDFAREGQTDLSPQLTLHTRVDLDRRAIMRVADLFRIRIPTGFQGQTSAQGHIRFAPGAQGYDLAVSNLVLLTDAVDLNVEARMEGLLHPEPPTMSSKWTSTSLAIQDLPRLLPNDWLASELYQTLRHRVVRGRIQAISATFSGSAREELGYSLGGEFHLSEGVMVFGQKWGRAERVEGVIHVQPDHIRLSEFHGIYNHIPITDGTGTIVLHEDGPRLTTELTGIVSPEALLGIMNTMADWDVGRYVASSVSRHPGRGIATVRFGGPLRRPEDMVFRSADYRPERVTVRLPGLPASVTDVEGLLVISPQFVAFENVTGVYGKSAFRIEGKMPFSGRASSDGVRIQGHMHAEDIVALLPRAPAQRREFVSGTADCLVKVVGSPATPTIRGSVDLRGLGIAVPGIIEKAPSLDGRLVFNVQRGGDRRFAFRHVSLTLPSVDLAGQGYLRLDDTPTINASFTTEPLHLAALPDGLRLFNKTISDGTLEVSLALKGRGYDWRAWEKSGWVALTKGAVDIDGTTPLISRVFLRARLDGHAVYLKHLQWNMGESRARATGAIRLWDSRPDVTLKVTSSQFDLSRFVPTDRRSPLRTLVEDAARTVTVSADLQFDRAWYKELSLLGLTGRLRIRNNVIGIEDIQGRTEHGTIQGRVLAHLPVRRPATMKTWFNVRDIPLLALEQTFLNTRALEKQLITGMVSAQGVLAGHGNDARGVLPTLNGNIRLSIMNGRIKRGTVIPKILTILNLPSVLQGHVALEKDGYPFDKQTGTLTIADGTMASEDIVIDGPILRMTAAGQFDFVHDDLDLVAAVSPLGSYFSLLRKIPLFELLLDDDTDGPLSALFAIKGSLHAPDVTPMPLESIAMGVTQLGKLALTILKNTLTMPKRIFFNDTAPSAPSPPQAESDDDQEEY